MMEKRKADIQYKVKIIGIYILSFVLPVVMMMWILASIGIRYNGETTILVFDMRSQYMPFIAGLRYVLQDWRNLLFNWNNSLGGNYIGVFAYYMASPFNLITLLWDIKDIANAMYVLYVLKIGLAGFTFHIYLHHRHWDMRIRFSNVVFSTCYALMSYGILYGICIMWLDAVILLPLVLLGVDRICDGKRGGLFFAAIALTFLSNFYMSYMVGIFAFLYLCVRLFVKLDRGNWKECVAYVMRFAANAVLALGLVMPMILPMLLNTRYSQLGRLTRNADEPVSPMTISQLLNRFLPCQYQSRSLYNEFGRPYFFCGSIFLILVPLFFFQKRRRREKTAFLLLGLSIGLGFVLPAVDYIWHGFRNPTGFPYRYAYLFSCWMIIVGYEAWIRMKFRFSGVITGVFVIYTLMELYANDTVILAGIHSDYGYDERIQQEAYYTVYHPLMQEIQKDTGFYRRKDVGLYYENADSLYNTKGTYFFSSLYYNRIRMFMDSMGAEKIRTGLRISMYGCTPLLDSLMGVKYITGLGNEMGLYEEKADSMGVKLYENPDALSLGYLIPKDATWREPEFTENVFDNQSLLLDYLGVPDSKILSRKNYEYEMGQEDGVDIIFIKFRKESDQEICFYLDKVITSSAEDYVSFYVDGELFQITNSVTTRKIQVLPELTVGEEHVVAIVGDLSTVKEFYLYEFDKDAYREEIEQFQNRQLEICSIDGNHIRGSICAEEEGILFVTLPYDEGYTVYVDGEKVQTRAALETFLSFSVTEGIHNIEIVYFPEGLKAGIAIMAMAVLFSAVYYAFPKRKDFFAEKKRRG